MKKSVFVSYLLIIAVVTTGLYHISRPGWILFRKAERLYSSRKFNESSEIYMKLFKQKELQDEVFERLGDSLVNSGSFDSAREFLAENYSRTAGNRRLHLTLAKLYEFSEDEDLSLDIYDSILEKDPGNRKALLFKARLMFSKDRLKEATKLYQKLLGDRS